MGLFGPPDVEKMQAKKDVNGLIKALGYQKDRDVRRDAAKALGEIGDPRVVEPLVAALKDEDSDVREAVAGALGQIDDPRAMGDFVGAEYPEWREVKGDLSLLPGGLLQALQKAMCFIVLEEGEERAAMIVRASKSEFRNPVDDTTPARLHIDRYSGLQADIFSLYPVIYDDSKDPFFKETWLRPYDDRPELQEEDPLSMQARKRLNLLLTQEYAQMLVVDEQDQILWARKVLYTKGQLKRFKDLAKILDTYRGRTISKQQAMTVVLESMNAVPLSQLRAQFLALLKEELPSG